MVFWISLGIFAAALLLTFLYSALVLASREDDFMEECYRKQQEELSKVNEEEEE